MTMRASLIRLLAFSALSGLLAVGCGDSGHSLGQSNGGSGGGGTTGTGGITATGGTPGTGGGSGGTTGTGGGSGGGSGGSSGHSGSGGHAGGGAAGMGGAAGSTGGSAGHGGNAGHGGAGGTAGGGSGGHAGGAGQGGQAGAQTCSSQALGTCPTGQVCDYDTPNRCAANAESGHCIVVPQGCTTDYTPVCGCDNKTYSNDCARQMARIQLDHTGPCAPSGGGGAPGSNCYNLTCDGTQTYCYQYVGGTSLSQPVADCKPITSACTSSATCTCLCANGVTCGGSSGCTCTQSTNGLITLSCYGA
jgi:Kazal-type serine protease inhibitor domain